MIELLVAIGGEFDDIPREKIRTFITGSGAGPLRAPLNSKFVQEVNSVTLWSSLKSFSFRLWDEQQEKLIGFGQLRTIRREMLSRGTRDVT